MFACNVANLLLNHNGGMQNKKGRTITVRVGDEVAEGSAGNAGNDRANCCCYKRLKISLALDGVFASRSTFMGR